MLLIFLLIFAFLALAIVRQVELGQMQPEEPAGHCPGCDGRAEADWLICPRCKEMLQIRCRGCGQRMPAFHVFCSGCGASRPANFGDIPDDGQI